jgi:hypothetical protein
MFRKTTFLTILLITFVMAGCATVFLQNRKAALTDAETQAALGILAEFHVDYVQDPIRYQAELGRLAKEHPHMLVIDRFLAAVEAAVATQDGRRNPPPSQ